MKQLAIAALAALGLLAGAAVEQARAQVLLPYTQPATSPFYRPPISPYLNLALPGNPALNYFGLVRPQLQTFNALQQLQTEVNQPLGVPGYQDYYGTGVLVTGHSFQFQNQWGYFQNWRASGAYGVGGISTGLVGPRVGLGGVGTGFLRPGSGMTGQQPKTLAPATGVQPTPTTTPPNPGTMPNPGTQPQ